MGGELCLLVTVVYNAELFRCALKINSEQLRGDAAEYPMEPENREQIYNLLPEHAREGGYIVAVERIYDIHDATPKPEEAGDGEE